MAIALLAPLVADEPAILSRWALIAVFRARADPPPPMSWRSPRG
jgi:hypothetical protein